MNDSQIPMVTWHLIDRPEWERRFTARIADRAIDGDNNKLAGEALKEIAAIELESWPEEDDDHNKTDWFVTLPEEAADEQMSNWLDDQEP